MLVSLTVGKVDAGVAVLLTADKRLIEFPSILLPPDIHSGSIVDINVARNQHAEELAESSFRQLQHDIFSTFGTQSPSAPVLRVRNTTQTSVVLEWDRLDLATAELRSLSLYRNGVRVGIIPKQKSCTKISGLALDTEYTFHLVLRTSAGVYASERVAVKTHKMTDLHGITITPGFMPQPLREGLVDAADRVGARMAENVRIDTTHFVCVEPRGREYEKALEMNIPVVVPDWLLGCEREGRIVGVRGYYLDADPKLRQMGPSVAQQQQQQQQQNRGSVSSQVPMRDSPRIEHTPPTPDRPTHERTTSGRSNGASAPTSAPTPPAKAEGSPSPATTPMPVPETDGQSSVGGSTLVQQPSMASDDDDDDENDNEEEDEEEDESDIIGDQDDSEADSYGGAPPTDKGKQPLQSSKDETSNREAKAVAEEDGKFDEVAL